MHTQHQKFITGVFLTLIAILGVAYYRTLQVPLTSVAEEVPVVIPEQGTTEADAAMGQIEARVSAPAEKPAPVTGKLKADTFTGTLEKVDTACFADGECFVEVDGKHVTAIMGWSQETVGSVMGVEGFGDLEQHIGEMVEVYAQEKGAGDYTLYGSEGFYIKLIAGTSEVQ